MRRRGVPTISRKFAHGPGAVRHETATARESGCEKDGKTGRMFFKAGIGILAIAALSTPAMANETAAATQITGVVDAAKAAPGSGDREFAELFAS